MFDNLPTETAALLAMETMTVSGKQLNGQNDAYAITFAKVPSRTSAPPSRSRWYADVRFFNPNPLKSLPGNWEIPHFLAKSNADGSAIRNW